LLIDSPNNKKREKKDERERERKGALRGDVLA